MNDDNVMVITVYGHEDIIDKISVATFDSEYRARNYAKQTQIFSEPWVKVHLAKEFQQFSYNELMKKPFAWERLVELNDRQIQRGLRETDSSELCVALQDTTDEIKDIFFRNMSKRAAAMLQDDLSFYGGYPKEEIDRRRIRVAQTFARVNDYCYSDYV